MKMPLPRAQAGEVVENLFGLARQEGSRAPGRRLVPASRERVVPAEWQSS